LRRQQGATLYQHGGPCHCGVILAHALASIVTREGKVLVRDLLPDRIPDSVRAALIDCTPERFFENDSR
jgi:hypothetical protein